MSEKAFTEALLDQSIQAEEKSGPQTVRAFTGHVEDRVREATEVSQEVFGDAARELVGPALREAQGYGEAKQRLLDPSATVADIASKGAAGQFQPSSGEVTYATQGMERKVDERYWAGVRRHEEVHEKDQAPTYNLSLLQFRRGNIPVHPNLIEWGAIRGANQPDADLTPEYVGYGQQGDALASFLGSREPLFEALRTGNMLVLQERIDAKEANSLRFALAA